MSKSRELKKEDLIRILRNAAVMFIPVILYLLKEIESGNLDFDILYSTSLGMIIAIISDAIRRYLTDYTK